MMSRGGSGGGREPSDCGSHEHRYAHRIWCVLCLLVSGAKSGH